MRAISVTAGATDLSGFKRYIENQSMDTAHLVLEKAAELLLKYVQAYSGRIAPPIHNSTQVRRAHTGGWADVSEDLRNKYYTHVEYVHGGWKMTIGNTSDHAVFVEARDGLMVVTGLMDKGGPIKQILRVAAHAVGAGWKVHIEGEVSVNQHEGWAPVSNLLPGAGDGNE